MTGDRGHQRSSFTFSQQICGCECLLSLVHWLEEVDMYFVVLIVEIYDGSC